MKRIFFATSSDVKYNQYRHLFDESDIMLTKATAIRGLSVEPQADASFLDSELNVVSHPLRLAARFASKLNQIPYMVEDTMLYIDAFSADPNGPLGLPGADTKSWWRNFGADGLLSLMKDVTNRRARFVCQLGLYIGAGCYIFSRSELQGEITHKILMSERADLDVPRSNPYYFHKVFCPINSGLALAEMSGDQFCQYDYRRRCVEDLLGKVSIDMLGATCWKQFTLFNENL